MNKFTKGLLTISLSAALLGSVACGGSSEDAWKGVVYPDGYGTVNTDTLGGFVAETDKYVYFINGVGTNYSENSFGTPIKGALVAADKTNLNNSQVVVPELFVASDYSAGVYIFGSGDETYAYYGTPNKEKNSSGSVDSSKLTFTRTRLDGKKNEKLFTVSLHSVNYRMAEYNGQVYIVYYDSEESAIMLYNCNTDKKTVVAKTDAENNEKINGEYLSLGDYKFLNTQNGVQVAYTMTVYTEPYIKEKAEQENSYTREENIYNYLYLYSAGQNAVIKSGKENNVKYELSSNVGDFLFYTQTKNGKTDTFAYCFNDNSDTKIDYDDIIKDDMLIKSLTKVYYFDSENYKVIEDTLIKNDLVNRLNTRKAIVRNATISSLIDVDDNYVYCYDSSGYIVAIERELNGKTIRISERTASSSWYMPETVEIDGKAYMLYCDNSTEGNSYIFYSNLNDLTEPLEQEVEDADSIYYLESNFIGRMPVADRAAVVTNKIAAIETPLDAEQGENNKFTAKSVTVAREAYNALDKDAKAKVSDESLKSLENAEEALKLWAAFSKLEIVLNYDLLSEEDKQTLTTDYQAAKAIVERLGDDFENVRAYLTDNLNYFYQQATSKLG